MPRRWPPIRRRNGRVDEDSRPRLASSREDLSLTSPSTDNVLFFVDGNEDEHETSALEDSPRRSKTVQTVRFREQVQVIYTVAPPLRSTLESREAGTRPAWLFSYFLGCASASTLPAAEKTCACNLYRV
jgi:hypothetical protein